MNSTFAFKKIMVVLAFSLSSFSLFAQAPKVDICMSLSGSVPNLVEIKMRPNFTIQAADIISEIRYTVSWQQSMLTLTPEPGIAPFNLQLQGGPVPNGGFYYQTFITQPNDPFGYVINAGQEVVIAAFTVTAPLWSYLYLTNDSYILDHNIQYYYEIDGIDRTGIIYCDSVQIAPDMSVPLSNWPIYMAIFLIAGTVIIMLKRI